MEKFIIPVIVIIVVAVIVVIIYIKEVYYLNYFWCSNRTILEA